MEKEEVKKLTKHERIFRAAEKIGQAIFKNTQGHGYKYMNLPSLLTVTDKILYTYNMMLVQPIIDDQVVTKLFDTQTGELLLESSFTLPDAVEIYKAKLEFSAKILTSDKPDANFNKFLKSELKGYSVNQEIGASETYLRRYAIIAMLGLFPDDDFDGRSARNHKALSDMGSPIAGSSLNVKPTSSPKKTEEGQRTDAPPPVKQPDLSQVPNRAPLPKKNPLDMEIEALYSRLPEFITNVPPLSSIEAKYPDKTELRDRLKQYVTEGGG